MRGLRAVGLGLAAAVVVVLAALAQTQAPQPTFRTEANYVRVDAYPTKDGAPVTDLTQADFDVFENGVTQKIEQFERVVIRAAGPQETRVEPNTIRESLALAQSARARVFVLFLDDNHVDVGGSHNIRKPLIDALDKLIGHDDLVGVMTPEMSARDVTFARKTTTIDGILTRDWTWGERDQINSKDPVEDQYRMCFPGLGPTPTCPDDDRGVADEMIERRREKMTIDALHDLVVYLRGVREERKAVLAISDGWRLFGQNTSLARQLYCQAPSGPQVGVDPRGGRLSTRPLPSAMGADQATCDRDRMDLAHLDDDRVFRDILDEANRANTSFYPIDPRGLVVFDEPIAKPTSGFAPAGSTTITPPSVDAARLRGRLNSLRTLAEATDGLAIVDSNDLARGFKRIVDDLSSYYLMGYYSTGRLDGRFHPITVRVKRPGVQVRARRGYLAATPGAATAITATRDAMAAPVRASAETAAVEAAIAPLAGYARELPLRLQVAAGWKAGDTASAAVWVVGEVGNVAAIGDPLTDGFEATMTLTTSANATVATARTTVPRGARTFRVVLTPSQPLAAGDYVLRVGAQSGPGSIPSRETLRFSIPASDSFGALFVRRGQSTGNKDVPTADLRFRRNEQVRVEVPATSSDAATARLLDRAGRPLAVPVTAATRDDGDGLRWHTAQLALAPLAPGDYVIEVASGDKRTLSAFRVVP
ncbi:MAG: VWA domain-containing protein [Acidobacteriia bacterium]|nr:VWA domain-containing protein [Terriglobia bacterium]